MHPLMDAFEERWLEVDAYLSLLENIALEAQAGIPKLAVTGSIITPEQQKILHSSVFLQLYNLVESSVARCLDYATKTAMNIGTWNPTDLTEKFRGEWVRVSARTHVDMNYENRLIHALDMVGKFVASLPVTEFKLDKGGGGNWDDKAIEKVADRIGLNLAISPTSKQAIKRKFKNDLACLTLIMKSRNWLAHGNISFAQAGDGFSASELRDLASRTSQYMREVVISFIEFVDNHFFLIPAARPSAVPSNPVP